MSFISKRKSIDKYSPNTTEIYFNSNLCINQSEISISDIKKISLEEGHNFKTIASEENKDYFELYENFIESLLKPSDWGGAKNFDRGNGGTIP
jgi:hypothetical protein